MHCLAEHHNQKNLCSPGRKGELTICDLQYKVEMHSCCDARWCSQKLVALFLSPLVMNFYHVLCPPDFSFLIGGVLGTVTMEFIVPVLSISNRSKCFCSASTESTIEDTWRSLQSLHRLLPDSSQEIRLWAECSELRECQLTMTAIKAQNKTKLKLILGIFSHFIIPVGLSNF